MTVYRSRLWSVALAALGLVLPRGVAQTYTKHVEDLISRPSAQGPSSSVGGRYTAGRQFSTLEQTRANVSLLGSNQYSAMSPWSRRAGRRAETLGLARPGSLEPMSPLPWADVAPMSVGNPEDAAVISGLGNALSLETRLPGVGDAYLPALDAYRYAPKRPTTPFGAFFGLESAEPVPSGPVVTNVAESMEDRTTGRVRTAEREGLALFKAATVEARDPRSGVYPTCSDCDEKLAKAMQRLTLVRDLDPKSYVSCLLMTHAALEQERPRTAVMYLLSALRRNPDLFQATGVPFATYFGDARDGGVQSAYLESQMRRYLGIGELNPDSAEARVIEAYCAWRLGDKDRVLRVARQAATLVEAYRDRSSNVSQLIRALADASR